MSRLKLTGKNLLDANSVQFTGQPIAGQITARVVPAEAPAADELSIEVTPPADLPRGTYQLAVVTAGGTSGTLPLEIDDLVQATEIEPNHLATETPIVALPLAIWGVVAARGDIDHARFEAKAGQTIVCELAARRFGSALNAVLTLLDPAGQVVAVNNDFDGQEDPLLAYRVPADGCYTVRVNDQAHNGSDKHFYRLSLGELPYVTGCFPVGVPANQESEVELAGYNLPPGTKVKVPASPPGEASVPIELNGFRIARPVKVLAAADSELIESEPNDTPAEATAIVAPGAVNGRIWARGAPPGEAQGADQDLFRFESQVGRRWVIETEGQRRGSPVDTRIEVLDVEGRPVTRALLQAVRDSYLEFRGVDSNAGGLRPKNWEEMELNEYVYVGGEVCKIFRMPQGPDSEVLFYTLGGRRRTFFDTSSTSHALGDPLYTVEPHEATERLIPNGLPVFPIVYANDDDSDHKLGRDSKLEFTAPAAGTYLVRVGDVRDFGGDRFVYRLVVREPQPDFQVSLADVNPTVSAGSGRRLSFNAERRDGFDGDITIDLAGLPPGFTVSTPLTIESGHFEARAVLLAAADAVQPPPEAWGQV
ncbi:MAG TPA: PPC domain-containing protein, partial [Pirellulales bacterium]|nr:PPC domain-containing protein [Pirellulales bacterium]